MSSVAVLTAEEIEGIVTRAIREALFQVQGPLPAGEFITTAQAAEAAGVTSKTIRTWVEAGLPAKKRGRRITISRNALRAWRSGESPQATSILASLTGDPQRGDDQHHGT
jgi:excisionase family DNA binding protein